MILTPITAFLFVLVIGIVCGLAFDRFMGAGWFTRQLAGATRHQVTSALVGVAGAFIGFHLFIILSIVSGIATLLGAIIGALVVLFVWHRI
jgi:uncharacterized membrane protein YeaQ/YmgE (transglycosylase-associated protein family)